MSSVAASPAPKRHGSWRARACRSCSTKCARRGAPRRTPRTDWPSWCAPIRSARTIGRRMPSGCFMPSYGAAARSSWPPPTNTRSRRDPRSPSIATAAACCAIEGCGSAAENAAMLIAATVEYRTCLMVIALSPWQAESGLERPLFGCSLYQNKRTASGLSPLAAPIHAVQKTKPITAWRSSASPRKRRSSVNAWRPAWPSCQGTCRRADN